MKERSEKSPLRVYKDEQQALEHARLSARVEACDVFVIGHAHPEASRLGPQPVVAGDFRSTGRSPLRGPYVRVKPDGSIERVSASAG